MAVNIDYLGVEILSRDEIAGTIGAGSLAETQSAGSQLTSRLSILRRFAQLRGRDLYLDEGLQIYSSDFGLISVRTHGRMEISLPMRENNLGTQPLEWAVRSRLLTGSAK